MKNLTLLPLFFLIASCAVPQARDAPSKQPIPMPKDGKIAQIELGPILPRLLPNEGTLRSQFGWLCQPAGTRTLNSDRLPVDELDLEKAFKSVVVPLNYRLKPATESVFEKAPTADFRLGGKVTKLHANLCYAFVGGPALIGIAPNLVKGNTFVEISWELLNVSQQKVIYSFTTQGKFESSETIPGGISSMFLNAFAANLRNLAAEKGFNDIFVDAAK
jgi:hypothetical protein